MAHEETVMHKCWLVRHGQRLDEVPNAGEEPWFRVYENRVKRYPLDAPLTEKGSRQAKASATKFLEQFSGEHGLERIFVSPLHRTLKTALEFAKALDLPLVVVPGLAACTAACQGGPIVEDKFGNLTLPSAGNVFLTKAEMRELCDGVDLTFHDSNLRYGQTLELLVKQNPRSMCVTHREGIRPLAACNPKEVGYCHITEADFEVDSKKRIKFSKSKTIFGGFKKDKKQRKKRRQ